MNDLLNKRPTVIDMFCGSGGLSKGFIDAGYKVVLGVDNNAPALETFKDNHKEAKVMNASLFEPSVILEMDKEIEGEKIDVIVGGPPCQGFSLTGKREEDDERNALYKSMVRAVEHFKPQAFVLENVPGLANLYGGKAKEEIIKDFTNLGYEVKTKILYGPEYGIPQIRRRLFFIGLNNGEEFEFPEKIFDEKDYVTTGEAISDLHDFTSGIGKDISEYQNPPQSEYQKKMRNQSDILYNHVGTRHTEHVINVISQVPEGGNHKDLPPGVGDSRKFNEAWTRYHSNKPSKTIDTGHRNHFHYKYNRVPTVRENARLQSFTDDFRFFGNKTEQYKQVGNAVPPLFGYYIGKQLLKVIKNRSAITC